MNYKIALIGIEEENKQAKKEKLMSKLRGRK